MAQQRKRRRRKRSEPAVRRPRLTSGQPPEQFLFDRTVRHSVELGRLSETEGRRLSRIWGEMEGRMADATVGRLERLQARGLIGPYRTKAYRETVGRIKDLADVARREWLAGMTEVMRSTALVEAAFQGEAFGSVLSGLNPELIFRQPPLNVLRGAISSPIEGRTLADWSKSLSQQTSSRIGSVVNRGLMRGEPLPLSTRKIRAELRTTRRQAEAVARTAIRHSSSAAREVLYQSNADLVIGVVWISTLDNRTTDICGALDGKTFPRGEGIRPPAHFNCRSDVGPLLRDPAQIAAGNLDGRVTQRDLDAAAGRRTGNRAAFDLSSDRNAPVPARQSYGEWFKRQPATWQDRMMGPTRARWVREGKLEVRQFVGKDHLPLTVGELRKRHGL